MDRKVKEAWKLLYRSLVERSDYPVSVYKYRPFSINSLSALQKHSLWFSSHEDFNDPYEGLLRPPYEEWNKQIRIIGETINEEDIKELGIEYLSTFNPLMKGQRICCFSRKNDDILLWTHYADEHRGFCLEFDVLEDVDFFLPIFPVVYEKDFAPAKLWDNPGKILEQLFQRKSAAWKYEEEVRIIKKGRSGLRSYCPCSLKSVIFGCRTSEKNINLVKTILADSVQYKRAEVSKTSYRLNIVELK